MFGFSSHGRCADHVGNHRAVANGARQYHAPSGAWHNPDRLAGNYPHLSPYAYCANNPLSIIDPSGDFLTIKYNDDEYKVEYGDDGNFRLRCSNGDLYEKGIDFLDQALSSLDKLGSKFFGNTLV